MPIPEPIEPEEPQPNTGLLEFINRRRMSQARQRRQRVLVAATAAFALIAVGLVVSNIIPVRRFAWRAETSSAPTPTLPPASAPVVSAPAAPAPEVSPAAAPTPPPPAAPAQPPAAATPAPVAPARTEPAPPVDSARRTARWLVQTHGRLEAENRAARVAEFYSGEQGAYWQRVLRDVRQEADR